MKKKDYVTRFFNSKIVKEILTRTNITAEEKNKIDEFFNDHDFNKERDNFKRYTIWLNMNKLNWKELNLQLKEHNRMSEPYFCILYGEVDGKFKWNSYTEKAIRNCKNTKEYWISRGVTDEKIIKENISIIQKERSSKRTIESNINGTVRRKEIWLNRGYTEEQAKQKVSSIQKRDTSFYIEKYGIVDGMQRYLESSNKRKNTWRNKSEEEIIEHARKTLGATYNKNGQEAQAINLFIEQNNLTEDKYYFRYGPPKEQHYEIIPNCGYRRYDLAVFDKETNKLVIIFEFHGPIHINFSDYNYITANTNITINGKELPFLGTYSKVFTNDYIKKHHIQTKYPDVIYCVAWLDNLKNKDLKIDKLKCK